MKHKNYVKERQRKVICIVISLHFDNFSHFSFINGHVTVQQNNETNYKE